MRNAKFGAQKNVGSRSLTRAVPLPSIQQAVTNPSSTMDVSSSGSRTPSRAARRSGVSLTTAQNPGLAFGDAKLGRDIEVVEASGVESQDLLLGPVRDRRVV